MMRVNQAYFMQCVQRLNALGDAGLIHKLGVSDETLRRFAVGFDPYFNIGKSESPVYIVPCGDVTFIRDAPALFWRGPVAYAALVPEIPVILPSGDVSGKRLTCHVCSDCAPVFFNMRTLLNPGDVIVTADLIEALRIETLKNGRAVSIFKAENLPFFINLVNRMEKEGQLKAQPYSIV